MPTSRSTTPKPNSPRPTATSSSSTSRHQGHESNTATQTAEEREEIIQDSSRQPHRASPLHFNTVPTPLIHSRPHTPLSEPMAKRLRPDTPEPTPRPSPSRSSPSSDDEGMADTEDASQSQQSQPQAPPAKKKRTRTLTTPHQAAVLHALLAQSRFPTTAMREEVGRSIGLSARKVQIWFQNQRQKARRPKNQGGDKSSIPRPPQYGPFPTSNDPSTSSIPSGLAGSVELPMILGGEGAAGSMRPGRYEGSSHYSSPTYIELGPPEPYPAEPPRLLGPGMPGVRSSASLGHFRRPSDSQVAGPSTSTSLPPLTTSVSSFPDPYSRRSFSPPSTLSSLPPSTPDSWRRPGTAQGLITVDPSRTLPPLIFNPSVQSARSLPSAGSRRTPPPLTTSPSLTMPTIQTPSPEEPFAFRAPAQLGSTTLPPPFTLQPQPQWDRDHFSTAVPRARSSWSQSSGYLSGPEGSSLFSPLDNDPRPHSSGGRISFPDTEIRQSSDSLTSSRESRFDPVRASLSRSGPPHSDEPPH